MLWLRTVAMLAVLTGTVQAQGQRRPAGCPVVLEGEVRDGQRFAKSFGGGLELELSPVEHGWVVRVHPVGKPVALDFAEVATPPFRSVNPLLLTTDFGFRSQDVVGWNPRSFHYVGSEAEFQQARRAEQDVVQTRHASQAAVSSVAEVVGRSKEGRLTILDARLVPGRGDQSAAAGLLATHFLSTAHTIVDAGGGGELGRVLWLRFRVTLGGTRERWDTPACGGGR